MEHTPITKREDALARMLRGPVEVTRVGRGMFASAQDEVITTCRLILILQGELDYTIEQKMFHLEAGTQFFVPSWVRRVWTAPRSSSCELIWCEFDDHPEEIGRNACFRRRLRGRSLGQEKLRYLELGRLCAERKEGKEALRLLGMEGLIKAMLSRFWMEAEPPETLPNRLNEPPHLPHPSVRQALRWLEVHFQRGDVIEALYSNCGLTPNFFRQRFKQAMLCSPQEYVQRLRLHRARYLLLTTNWQQKRIAAEVGYDDPLYFSRLYHRFWGHSPSEEHPGSNP